MIAGVISSRGRDGVPGTPTFRAVKMQCGRDSKAVQDLVTTNYNYKR